MKAAQPKLRLTRGRKVLELRPEVKACMCCVRYADTSEACTEQPEHSPMLLSKGKPCTELAF